MDDSRLFSWGVDHTNYMQTYKQQVISFSSEDEIYFDDFDQGVVSMQPMQRFMLDQCPLTPGLLNAKIPLQIRPDRHYEQQWPSADCFRNPSPDRTSASGNSSAATQNELHSPHTYHSVLYGSPTEYFQTTLPYPSTEHFHDGSYLSEEAVHGGCTTSLREVEYEHLELEPELEPITEEVDSVDIKQETGCDRDHDMIKVETTSSFKYADSGIGNSVRDAESVQPIDFYEEPASDSDYSPSSSRSGKRRRSSGSNSSSGRTQRRRGHGRKDSQVSSTSTSTKPPKRARGASNASRGMTDMTVQPDERRPFPCPLAGYGCVSNFSSKNEWKRHVSTQHIKLGYWRCDLCQPTTDANDNQSLYYNDFNRKDLFTQHLRRMHAASKDNSSRNQKEFPVTEDNLPDHQTRCFRSLRDPPQQSSCLFCDRTFDGPSSWEERMEHVGRHLEKDRKTSADMFDYNSWNMNQGLEQYLLYEGLIVREKGGWKIGDGKPKRPQETADESEEE
ncbi:hypothetical protein N0V83_003870 [Neocucurbitaria cava]|uniref:Uncharacterized protein n=1 Tax=Neocucurbitaria cava TaxID=798079 RepID=A0A9W9CMR8_9PLEO|nr:hypothetical protein N0V83_003870 [Neocucurbitaria cava]